MTTSSAKSDRYSVDGSKQKGKTLKPTKESSAKRQTHKKQ